MINQFIFPLRVYIEDTDYQGIVYHPNYLKFMERARLEWGDQLGIGFAFQEANKIHLTLHSVSIKFIKPAKLFDKLEVVSSIIDVGRASFSFGQHLRLAHAPDKILSKAEFKIACVDYAMRPCAIPEGTLLTSIRRTLT